MFKKSIIFFCILSYSSISFSQKAKITEADKSYAKELFINHNFKKASVEYSNLLKTDADNISYQHNLALCYLNLGIEKDKTVKLLENITKQTKSNPNSWYDLGLAYQKLDRFEDAIISYRKFREFINNKDENYIPAIRQIEMCENAKIMIKKPINVVFENLGNEINTIAPDFKPYISSDENYLIFTSKRNGNIGNLIDIDGFNTADIFYTNFSNKWGKPKRFPTLINSALSEDCTGLTADGTTMTIHYDNDKMMGDILTSELKGKSFLRPINASYVINSDKEESAACFSPDKQTMFFASMREGGEGAKDLYYTRKLPSGDWSDAINLGSNINTVYDENYPYIAPDGETLYFCSVGHNSMGGYDIFKAKWDKDAFTFSKPENIGYPINTPEDERTISFTQSGRYAYLDINKKDGMGECDIFKIIFNDIPPAYTVISGKVSIGDTLESELASKKIKLSTENIKISVIDKKTALPMGKYALNKITAKYIVILPPGEYLLKFEGENIKDYDYELIIPDRENTEKEIYKDILITLKEL